MGNYYETHELKSRKWYATIFGETMGRTHPQYEKQVLPTFGGYGGLKVAKTIFSVGTNKSR